MLQKSSLRDNNKYIIFINAKRGEFKDAFCIGMNSDHTLEEVGQQFSVTRENTSNRSKSMRKLKHPTRARKLKTFLDE